jgi:hypothetical protein
VQLPESLDSGIEREKGGNMQGEVGWLLAFGFWLLAIGFWLLGSDGQVFQMPCLFNPYTRISMNNAGPQAIGKKTHIRNARAFR